MKQALELHASASVGEGDRDAVSKPGAGFHIESLLHGGETPPTEPNRNPCWAPDGGRK